MQFRKKPVVIDASQWFKHGDHPVVTELPANRRLEGCAYDDACGWVPTLEGGHVVTPGDWIITGIKGEHYPCKPDIFDETYECAPDPLPVELQHAAAQRGFEHEAACDRALTAAQPADSAMEVLRELVSEVEASKNMDDLAGRMQWVYERARALVAKETP